AELNATDLNHNEKEALRYIGYYVDEQIEKWDGSAPLRMPLPYFKARADQNRVPGPGPKRLSQVLLQFQREYEEKGWRVTVDREHVTLDHPESRIRQALADDGALRVNTTTLSE
ncbi:MAG: hypothetical protein OK454_03090, partial [Thaumarchaeota archaeon]|nr:hypothetical protein [Nitrososphaerota archaeon]